jgi:hypothetical protein
MAEETLTDTAGSARPTTTGGCLCGDIRYEIAGKLRDVVVCHCRQCQKWSGYLVAATAVAPGGLTIFGEPQLRWYRASSHASRGFCRRCGSSLFWKPDDGAYMAVMAGGLDMPSGLTISSHIFCADKADYDRITDTLPCFAQDSDVQRP